MFQTASVRALASKPTVTSRVHLIYSQARVDKVSSASAYLALLCVQVTSFEVSAAGGVSAQLAGSARVLRATTVHVILSRRGKGVTSLAQGLSMEGFAQRVKERCHSISVCVQQLRSQIKSSFFPLAHSLKTLQTSSYLHQ